MGNATWSEFRWTQSVECEENRHGACAHYFRAGNLANDEIPQAVLCQCQCHERCPVASTKWVPIESWRVACNCPGATRAKAERPAFDAASMERGRLVVQIFDEIRLQNLASRDGLLTELRRAYEERGIEPELGEVDAIADTVETWNSQKHASRNSSVVRRWISEVVKGIERNRETT